MRRRTVVPQLTTLEDRTTPAVFTAGSVQGQDGWTGGDQAISPLVTQGVNQGNGLAHQGTGSLVVSNGTANGDYSGWPFGPALSAVAGQPASGATADLFTATVWFRTVATVADGSNLEINLGTADGSERNSIIGFANYTDADGGLRLYFTESEGTTGNVYQYEYGGTLTRGEWHRLDISATFRDGSANDTLTLAIDGTPFINPATNAPEIGTLEGYYEGQATLAGTPYTYHQTSRLMFRSGFKASDLVTGASDTAAAGFALDDISYSSAASSAPNTPLASYYAAFESQPTLVYARPSWSTLAAGTPVVDANPYLPGNQPATVGVDAFGTLGSATAAVADGGQVWAFPPVVRSPPGGPPSNFSGGATVRAGTTLNIGGVYGTGVAVNVGSVAFASGSTFAVDILDPASSIGYDQLTVVGTANIGGSTLELNAGYTPAPTESFTILRAGSVVGQFAGLPEGAVVPVNGLNFKVRYTSTAVVLELDRADVSVTVTDNQSSVTAGQQVTYTAVVTNTGPRAVSGAAFTLTPPAALLNSIFGSVAAGGATGHTSGAGPISNTLTLPVGATVTYTVTGTVSVTASGNLSVSAAVALPSDTYVDPNTANNSDTDTDTITPADTTRPTVQITSPDPLVVGSAGTLTIQFSEAVSGFDAADVGLTNATAGTLSGSGTTYTLTVTPTAPSVQAGLLDGAAADAAGNPSVATSAGFTATVPDTTRPTAQITSPNPLVVGTAGTLTITFSELVNGFVPADVGLTNATLTSFNGNGITFTVGVTPTGTGVGVSLLDGAAADAAGNLSFAALATFPATVPDTTRPTAVIVALDPVVVGTPGRFLITFSEAVSGFVSGDVLLTNATAGTLSGSGTTYTLTVTPTAENVQVSLPDGAATDAAGNPSVAHTATLPATVPDTTRPTAVISANGRLVVGSPMSISINFSEPVSGFSLDQLVVSGATLNGFGGSGASYFAVIVPTGTNVAARVPDGAGQDAAGNPSVIAASTFAATRPQTPPVKPSPRYATAVGNTVTVFNPTDGSSRQFEAFPGFAGTVTVATGDLNGDGIPETVVAAGPGGGPHVRAFDGATAAEVASFFAYDPAFTGGVFVAAGGGRIITGAGAGGGPHVKVIYGSRLSQKQPNGVIAESALRANFFAYDAAFAGGVRVAAGDVTGDGVADIVTAAGAGGGPHVKAFDGNSMTDVRSFMAFDTSVSNGVYVAVGNGQIFAGVSEGGGSRVKGFDRAGNVTADFSAFDSFTGGVRVAVNDVNNDGVPDLLAAAGPGGGPHVKAFALPSLAMTASFFAAPLALPAVVRFGSDFTAAAGSPGVFVG